MVCWHVVAVLGACLCGACAVTPAFPVRPSFTASVALHPLKLSEIGGTAEPYFSKMSFRFDATLSTFEIRSRYKTFAFISPAFEYLESRTVCSGRDCSTLYRNGTACFSDILPNIKALFVLWDEMASNGYYVGPGSVEGTDCDLWQIQDAAVGNLTLCMGSDGVPRSMLAEPSAASVGKSNVFAYSQNLTLQDIVLGASNVSIATIQCPAPQQPEACAGHGVSSQQILRFTNGEPWGELWDRDTCDWTGVGVTGGAPGYWSFMQKRYLEIFDVELDTAYSPFRDCNWDHAQKKYVCLPELPADLNGRVSRCSAEGLQNSMNASAGQCGDNAIVGSWLVFPHQGQCKDGQVVGDDGCTWKMIGFKVVEVQPCFFNPAGADAWTLDWQKAPFPHVMDYMKERVAACPDVASPSPVYP